MPQSRITFFGNPWSEGHPIKKFRWLASKRNGQVWCDLHLETEDYDAERPILDDDNSEYPSDWESPIVWDNYHSCTISSNKWHNGGFPLGNIGKVSLDSLNGMEFSLDNQVPMDCEKNAFHVYLLGHDAVAYHRIIFFRILGTDFFNIQWIGKIAQAYIGDYEYRHDFEANIFNVQAPDLPVE